jgi:tetratricopeptide (TPR) repeat protein
MGTTGDTLAAGNEAMMEAAFRTGDYETAERTFEELLSRARADGDRALEAAVLDRQAMLMHFRALDDDPAKADSDGEESLFQQALEIRRGLGDPAGTAESLFGLGLVHQVLRQDWDAAMPYYWEALDLADRYGDLLLRSEVHRHVGFYYAMSDLQSDKALEHLRISHELRAELGDRRWIPGGTIALGIAELADGLREQGLAHVRESVAQAHEAGLSTQRIAWMEDFLRKAEAGQSTP